MSTFFGNAAVVALAEFGDKTQLLAVVMAATFRKPAPVLLGCILGTALNHALVASISGWIALTVHPAVLRWGVGLAFLATMGWLLTPDKPEELKRNLPSAIVFFAALLTFFLAEFGDKSQLATPLLVHREGLAAPVVMATTLGMVLSVVPAVVLGSVDLARDPMRALSRFGAATFGLTGALVLMAEKLPF